MNTFARLKSPLFGRGKAKLVFTKSFKRWQPIDQMSAIEQAMRQLRKAHDEASANHRAQRAAEDEINASLIAKRA